MTHVASGHATPGVMVVPADVGALVGDLVLLSSPYENFIPSGYTQSSAPNWGHGYTQYGGWRVITDLAAAWFVGSGSYGIAWSIYRGPNAATFRAWNSSGSDTVAVNMPGALGDTVGYAAVAHDRSANAATGVAPAGWVARHASAPGTFTHQWWSKDSPDSAAHTDVFTGFSTVSGFIQIVAEWELRKI